MGAERLKKILTVVGARPQFVKAAVVSRLLRQNPAIREILLHTGQHYDESLSEIFFQELEIPAPDFHLGIGSGSHGAQTGRMLAAIEEVLIRERPGLVLVYGDTNSTLAGALAAAKLKIPVAHVEAGLRSFNRGMPEEINRVLVDQLATLLLAPTETAVANLLREGSESARVHLVGDVMFDAARYYAQRARDESCVLERLALEPKRYCLATLHRAENTDDPVRLREIFAALGDFASELTVVLPLHPRTRQALRATGPSLPLEERLRIIDPLGYLDMTALELYAALIATDSGGVQKEAFFHRVPCVTLREETEWVELVAAGWNRLAAPLTREHVAATLRAALDAPAGEEVAPYGAGASGEKIVELLLGC